jgi:nitrogen fixation NifU-like protein
MTDQLYKEYILDLYRNPLNAGRLIDPDASYTAYNPTCGDEITVDMKLDDSGKISDIRHHGQGCAISIAAVSLMTDMVKGMDKSSVLALTLEDVVAELGVNIDYTRQKCALIGLKAIQSAIRLI